MDEAVAAPNWRLGGVLIGLRHPNPFSSDFVRTLDGGATWEWLPGPGPYVTGLTIAPNTDGSAVLFVTNQLRLYRSEDNGSTWNIVLDVGTDDGTPYNSAAYYNPPMELAISPDVGDDGLMFAITDLGQFRSTDTGRTWEKISPVPRQQIWQVAFSPDIARDHTIFAAVVTGGFPEPESDPKLPTDPPTHDHERSAGVMVSHDNGQTWQAQSAGLEVDGIPYRHVQQIVPSPTFAEDGTLFAVAWGPRGGGTLASTLVFRSQDRGMSWEQVGKNQEGMRGGHSWPYLALSPDFVSDGIALIAWQSRGLTPASGSCQVLRTADHGASWAIVRPEVQYSGCGGQPHARSQQPARLILNKRGDNLDAYVSQQLGWEVSQDGGQTWSRFLINGSPPYGPDRFVQVLEENGTITLFRMLRDGTLVVQGTPPAAPGTYPCTAVPDETHVARYGSLDALHSQLGCAVTVSQDVPVLVRRDPADPDPACQTVYVPDLDIPYWVEIKPCQLHLAGSHASRLRLRTTYPEPQLPAADSGTSPPATAQRYERGILITLPDKDGLAVVIRLDLRSIAESSWTAVP
jgi:hypothetical protein